MRHPVKTRIPRPQLPLLGVLYLASVSHAAKSLKAGAEESIRGKVLDSIEKKGTHN
jgi:hypothetical protein